MNLYITFYPAEMQGLIISKCLLKLLPTRNIDQMAGYYFEAK